MALSPGWARGCNRERVIHGGDNSAVGPFGAYAASKAAVDVFTTGLAKGSRPG